MTQEIGHQMEGVANGEPCLKLITGGRTLYFFADTADETRAWVSAMKTNIGAHFFFLFVFGSLLSRFCFFSLVSLKGRQKT